MSTKRQATTELNHENWDQEDVADDKADESTGYQIAPKEILEKRVIRTARRRIQNTDSEGKKSVFSGFSGFNKPPPSSFDFLANLTNGQKNVGSSLFGSSKQTDNKSANTPLFSMSGGTTSTPKTSETSVFGAPFSSNTHSPFTSTAGSTMKETPQKNQSNSPTSLDNPLKQTVSPFSSPQATSTIFGASTSTTADTSFKQNVNSSPFNASQASTLIFGANIPKSTDNSVKQNVTTSPFMTSQASTMFGSTTPTSTVKPNLIFGTNIPKSTDDSVKQNVTSSPFMTSQASTTMFGSVTPTSTSVKQNLNSSPFNTNKVPTTIFGTNSGNNSTEKPLSTTANPTLFKIQANSSPESTEPKKLAEKGSKNDDYKLNYYTKLQGLNVSVSDWIKQHVEKTPLCILSPIFQDYEKYLKDIQDEYESKKEKSNNTVQSITKDDSTQSISSENSKVSNVFAASNATKSVFETKTQEKTSNFSFGINTSSAAVTSANTTQSAGFSFGIKSSSPSSTSNPSLMISGSNGSTPFSFGNGKPFSFNSNIKKPEEPASQGNENEDEPPKVEFTPVVEENSVYDKKCKIFIKKDGNFIDKGVGTLYVKKVEDSDKHQLLVRANTNLGTVLLNLILSSSIPTQRMGKNNVMMVCIPTPEAKPPPVPILIRVKTSEEADELLSKLDKFKV